MATKEKINLLEVIPCRNEHIKAEQEGETIVLSFPRFKRSWMSRYLLPKGMSKDIHVRLEEHGTAGILSHTFIIHYQFSIIH